MKNIIAYIIPAILFASCKAQQFDTDSMSGRYVGADKAKNNLSAFILLDLHKVRTEKQNGRIFFLKWSSCEENALFDIIL